MTLHNHPSTEGLLDEALAELHRHQAANLTDPDLAHHLARLVANLPEEDGTLVAEAAFRLARTPARPSADKWRGTDPIALLEGYDWSRQP